MPTVKNIPGPYRFFFYSFNCNEPKHVHVQREKKICKILVGANFLEQKRWFLPKRAEFNSTDYRIQSD
jgi:Domain of unknown function (DUF4160)